MLIVSARLQFVLYAAVVTLLSAGATAVTYRMDQQRLASAATAARLEHMAHVVAAGIQHAVGDVLKDGRVLGAAMATSVSAPGGLAANRQMLTLVRSQIETHPEITEVRFIGPPPDSTERLLLVRGPAGIETKPPPALQDRGDCAGYQTTIELVDGSVFVSPVMWEEKPDGVREGPMIRGAIPLYVDDELEGVMVLTLDLRPLLAMLTREGEHESVSLHLADSSELVFYPPLAWMDSDIPGVLPRIGDVFPELDGLARRLSQGDATHAYSADGKRLSLLHRFLLEPSLPGRYLSLVLTQRVDTAVFSPGLLGQYGLIAIAIMGVFAIASALYFLRRFSEPLTTLSDRARRIAEGDFQSRPEPQENEGMTRELSAEMDRMAECLERREQDLRTANHRLERLNFELEQYTYLAAHDLKAPLRAVSHIASVVCQEMAGKSEGAPHPLLPVMIRRVTGMHRIIDGLLLYARAGDDGTPIETVDSGRLLKELLDQMPLPAGTTVEVHPKMPTLQARRSHLAQVFRLLVDNAIRHHDRPERARIRIWSGITADGYRFTIADDGPGIPAAYRSQIFRLFQVLNSGEEGTGIGLPLASKLVTANGGSIEVHENHPRGTRFVFSWRE